MAGPTRHTRRRTRKMSVAQQASSALRKVNKIQRSIELKHSDTNSTTNVTDSGVSINLSNISQGDTEVTRTGDKITIKGINCRYDVRFNPTVTVPQTVRVVLLQAHTTDAQVTLPITDFYDIVAAAGEETLAPTKWGSSIRARTLYDKSHVLFDLANNDFQVRREFFIPSSKLRDTIYTPGASIVEKGLLNLLVWSDEASANEPIFRVNIRVVFSDF